MAKNIEPRLAKVGTYLKLGEDTIFTIPEYQRAYSWGIDNCDKLWQDIVNYSDSNSKDEYFFGTIIVNCQENDTKYSLIDGQQRTTTFLLLLKALLVRINEVINNMPTDEDSESLVRGLKERRRKIIEILYKVETEYISDKPDTLKDKEIYNNVKIIENYSINEYYKEELNNILSTVDYIEAENKSIKIPNKRKDNKYTNFFRNYKFFYEKVSELQETKLNKLTKILLEKCEVIEIKSWNVEQAITMFNSLNSDGLPLYDSDIISAKLYANSKESNCSDEFSKLWKQLTEKIEELKYYGIVSMDSVLMQYMYYQRALRKEIINESGSINVTTPGLRRYFTEINTDVLNNPIEFSKDIIKLVNIWQKIAEYPTAQVLFKFNENSKLFLASYFYRFDEKDITEEQVEIILKNMLRLFTILELVDIGYSSNKFKTFLFGQGIKLVDKNVSLEEITQDFDKHIKNNWTERDIEDILLEYEKNAVVYLNEYLFAKENDIKFKLGTTYDIEHIMPYSGGDIIAIRKDADISNQDEFYKTVNKLGNKILLEQKINRAIGNKWFRTKVSTKLKDKTGYIDSNYPIAKMLVERYKDENKPYWTKKDINFATENAVKRIINFIFG